MTKVLAILAIAILLVVFAPIALIWAMNTLFPALAIPYTVETWFAAFIIPAALRSEVSFKGK